MLHAVSLGCKAACVIALLICLLINTFPGFHIDGCYFCHAYYPVMSWKSTHGSVGFHGTEIHKLLYNLLWIAGLKRVVAWDKSILYEFVFAWTCSTAFACNASTISFPLVPIYTLALNFPWWAANFTGGGSAASLVVYAYVYTPSFELTTEMRHCCQILLKGKSVEASKASRSGMPRESPRAACYAQYYNPVHI